MDKIFESIGKVIADVAKQQWVSISLGALLITFLLVVIFLTIKKFNQGSEVTIGRFLFIKPHDLVQKQKAEFEKLNADAKQKTHVIKLLQQLSSDVSKAIASMTNEEFMQLQKAVYQYILPGIGRVLTKQQSNNHRVAIFIKENDTDLKIHEGIGFSSEGLRNLRLLISDSAAGRVMRTGESYFSGDVYTEGNTFTRHPSATTRYQSLICVPVKVGDMILAVLSIDGEEVNSFTKDDEDYLKYFANALAPFLYLELFRESAITHAEGGKIDDTSSSA